MSVDRRQLVERPDSDTLRHNPSVPHEVTAGTTLDKRIASGPLAVADAIAIARQITTALDAAHAQRLTHGDLTPSTVLVREGGTVTLLDSGIAKASAPGTSPYLSPEQARGQTVDAGTDIWAFGCVLFEMLSGRALFQRASAQDTLAAILTAEPDWSALPPDTPPGLVRLLRRCLQRDRALRLREAADAGFALDDLAPQSHVATVAAPRPAHRPGSLVPWGLAALCAVLAASVLIAIARLPSAPARPLLRFEIPLPQTRSLADRGTEDRGIAISPHGMSLAFVAAGSEGQEQLWIRRLDQLEPAPLSRTQGAYAPFWSPDGLSIGFFADGKLKRVSAGGGDTVVICDVAAPATVPAGAWGPDDTILFAQTFGPLHKVAASGGLVTPATVIRTGRQEFGHYFPIFLPDGRHFAFEIGAVPQRLGIHVGSLTSTDTTRLMPRSVSVSAITAGGMLLFRDERTLRAQKIDFSRMQPIGDTVLVADGVAGFVSASATGTIVYQNESSLQSQLTWVNRTGRALETVGPPRNYVTAALSPDNRKVAVARDGDIWVVDLERGNEWRVTSDPSNEILPQWSPDGREILFNRGIVGPLVKRPVSGAGVEDVVLETGGIPWGWSTDGRLTYGVSGPDTFLDLWVLSVAGDRTPRLYLRTPSQDLDGRLSPDGTLMAYSSALSGRQEIYVQPFAPSQERWPVSTAGGKEPRWRADGRELFYVAGDGRLMAVDVSKGARAPMGVPRALFQTGGRQGARDIYSPSSDGQRFLLNRVLDGGRPSAIVLVNWTAAVQRADRP